MKLSLESYRNNCLSLAHLIQDFPHFCFLYTCIIKVMLYPNKPKRVGLCNSEAGFDLSLLCCHCCDMLLCNDRVTIVVFRMEEQHDSSHLVNPLGLTHTHVWTHRDTQLQAMSWSNLRNAKYLPCLWQTFQSGKWIQMAISVYSKLRGIIIMNWIDLRCFLAESWD